MYENCKLKITSHTFFIDNKGCFLYDGIMPIKKQVTRRRQVKRQPDEASIVKKESLSSVAVSLEAEEKSDSGIGAVAVESQNTQFEKEVQGEQEGNIKRSYFTKHSVIFISAIIVLVVALSSSGYFFLQYQNTQKLLKDPGVASSKEIENIVGKIAKLIELPQGEQPTLATVSDVNKLKGQAFFAKAQNNDKVLIFEQAKKAYLYRPSSNRLIDVAPVSFPTPVPEVAGAKISAPPSGSITPGPSEAEASEVKVALYNGSGVTGITRIVEAKLTDEMKEVAVSSKENANSRDYAETIIVDLTQRQSSSITRLIEALGVGKKGALPTGETKPEDADILVILGSDYK